MKQAIMTAPGKITFADVEKPVLNPGQVLIKIMRIGVCGSDIHVYHGKHPFTTYPVVQGHEVSGRIVEVFSDVKTFVPGDKVTVQPQVVCGKCYSCVHGDYHICDNLKVMGFQTTGMASEYFAVDAEKVLGLPADMSYDDGAIVEPLAVACHCTKRGTRPIKGQNVVVFGAGPIGNLVAQTAKAKGAAKVMITDVSAFRLDIAKACGIDYAVNSQDADVLAEIEKAFGKDKADIIFDCAGNQATVSDAVRCARKGTDIIMVAVVAEQVKVDLGVLQDRELKIIGTLMYKEEDYLEAIELLAQKKIHTSKIITDYFDFADYDAAYKLIEQRRDKAMKVMIKVSEDAS